MLLDTHVWLWFVLGAAELAGAARRRIEDHAEGVLLSPISIWEALVLIERTRLNVKSSASTFVRQALDCAPFRQAPLTAEIAMRSREREFRHDDPADRFLAATADVYGVPLMTRDERLLSLKWLSCVRA